VHFCAWGSFVGRCESWVCSSGRMSLLYIRSARQCVYSCNGCVLLALRGVHVANSAALVRVCVRLSGALVVSHFGSFDCLADLCIYFLGFTCERLLWTAAVGSCGLC
jgi:hypothetical protein